MRKTDPDSGQIADLPLCAPNVLEWPLPPIYTEIQWIYAPLLRLFLGEFWRKVRVTAKELFRPVRERPEMPPVHVIPRGPTKCKRLERVGPGGTDEAWKHLWRALHTNRRGGVGPGSRLQVLALTLLGSLGMRRGPTHVLPVTNRLMILPLHHFHRASTARTLHYKTGHDVTGDVCHDFGIVGWM